MLKKKNDFEKTDSIEMNDILLFYSEKCPFSIKCLELLEPHADKINFIGYVNIHKSKGFLPLRVRRVPTLIINEGETIHEGREVYLWIQGLVNMMQTQQGFKKELPEQKENTSTPLMYNSLDPSATPKDPLLETVWSSSTLTGNSSANNNSYASIDNNKTITETINYSRIKSINQEKEKLTVSPESIESLRSTELEKIRPNPIKRF